MVYCVNLVSTVEIKVLNLMRANGSYRAANKRTCIIDEHINGVKPSFLENTIVLSVHARCPGQSRVC